MHLSQEFEECLPYLSINDEEEHWTEEEDTSSYEWIYILLFCTLAVVFVVFMFLLRRKFK